jgi:Rrf2 family protein
MIFKYQNYPSGGAMPRVWKISEACSMAMHAMTMLAASTDRKLTTREIASFLKVSEAHLSKVLQRLARAGLVKAVRGPRGGFELVKPGDETTLLEVYEAIEGPLEPQDCLFSERICEGDKCILGGLLDTVDREVRSYLEKTRLSKLVDIVDRE